MKLKYIAIALFILTIACEPKSEKYKLSEDRLTIQLEEGMLNIIPLSDDAIRVKLESEPVLEDDELILTKQVSVPDFKFSEHDGKLSVSTNSIAISFDQKSGTIEFTDSEGKVFLSEKTG